MRVALCVGCNTYDYLSLLAGAENDATDIFTILTDDHLRGYDPNRSALLLSPNVSDLKTTLARLLYAGHDIDVFSIFFAGHATVAYETLYLGLRDSDVRTLPLTGYSFSELVRAVVAARPAQANFILDACSSAGLAYDLHTILRGSLTGTAESTGVSFLAAAGTDEFAREDAGGGRFTRALIPILSGDLRLQSHNAFLDLTEIGSALRFASTGSQQQTVSRWALNLQGPSRFVHNQHFNHGTHFGFEYLGPTTGDVTIAQSDVAALTRLSLQLREDVEERELAQVIQRVTSSMQADNAIALRSGLAAGMLSDARACPDVFAEARVASTLLGTVASLINQILHRSSFVS
jgi:hypothetical protein